MKSVTRIFSVIAAAAAIVFVAGCAPLSMEDPHFVRRTDKVEHVVLKFGGTPGQSFSGEIKVDGKLRPVWGKTPVEYPLDVCVLTGNVKKTAGDGEIHIEITRTNGLFSAGILSKNDTKLRFGYHDGGVETRW